MKIYIDTDYKCHTESAESLREFDVSFFDGKCRTLIEGYRYVPNGETWIREDGTEFKGEMISPFVDYSVLAEAQRNYEDGYDECNELVTIITKGVSA